MIPNELIDREKQGFGVPIYEWFLDKLGERARNELLDFCDLSDFLDRHEVVHLIDRREHEKIWFLLNFALWWREYIAT